MYLEHFGLREAPFSITPHTEFFFAGANRGTTLDALIYAITHDEGIVKVSGEVGSGKTMLCRMLLEKLPEHVETVYLSTPSLSPEDILHAIADELGLDLIESRNHRLMRTLQKRLVEIYQAGRQVVIMIDEAHAMPAETLEEIRLLSNLESNRHKLVHIVLFGQPELDERLADKSMRQLKDRITHNFSLMPLHSEDIGHYLMFRLRAAGYRGPDLFTPRAIKLLSRASEGLTRRINILADKALLAAFSQSRHHIDAREAKAAIKDAQFQPMRAYHDFSRQRAHRIAIATTLLAIAAWGAFLYRGAIPSVFSTPYDQAPAGPLGAAGESGQEASLAQPPSAASSVPAKQTLAERIAATEDWLKKTPETHYFIQLLSTEGTNFHDVELFLDQRTKTLDQDQIRVYRSHLSGRDRLGVIYGDFPSREAAQSQLAEIMQVVASGTPYLRTVSKLR